MSPSHNFKHQASLVIIARWWSSLTVTFSPTPFSKKYEPKIPLARKPHQTVVSSGSNGSFWISIFCFSSYMRQFCMFTYPLSQKWASALKKICFEIFENSLYKFFSGLFLLKTLKMIFNCHQKPVKSVVRSPH